MTSTRFSFLIAVFFAFVATTVHADSIPELFEKLRDSGEDYQNSGAVCEQVARLEMQRDFPPQAFEIVTGIIYADINHTIGELDVVVFDRRRGNVVLVGEVKCWNDLSKARKKAAEQRSRFLNTMATGVPIDLFLASNQSVFFRREQFQGLTRFISISQRGGRAYGFDRDLQNSLAEMRQLREALMQCQAAGQCRRP